MRTITAIENVTLDGVMQAPGRPEEDTRGGFTRGGWGWPYQDDVMMGEMSGRFGNELLLGRRTYEDFYSFWPKQEDNPFTEVLNATQKYVVSSTPSVDLPWQNSTQVAGNEAVAELKKQSGANLTILGSGELVRSLIKDGLIDEYLLMIHPLVLGSGMRLFADEGPLAKFDLVTTTTTTTGVIIATYKPTNE